MDQPVHQDIAVDPAIVSDKPAIREEVRDIEIMMAKLKALTNGEDLCPQDAKTTREQVPGGKKLFSRTQNQDNDEDDIAWPGYPATIDPRIITIREEDMCLTNINEGCQHLDAPPIAVLKTTPDPPPHYTTRTKYRPTSSLGTTNLCRTLPNSSQEEASTLIQPLIPQTRKLTSPTFWKPYEWLGK